MKEFILNVMIGIFILNAVCYILCIPLKIIEIILKRKVEKSEREIYEKYHKF